MTKIVVGLGNPGRQYQGTRHNIGFAVVDLLAQGPGVQGSRSRFQSELTEMTEGDEKILLVKPQTYMNLSGRAVRQLVDFYQTPLENVLVVCDDINLPLGKIRFRSKGSHGGHNGLRDIQNHLGGAEYSRLRIGVGAPSGDETVDHVLGRFKRSELPVVEEAVQDAVEGVVLWIAKGIHECMNQYNGK